MCVADDRKVSILVMTVMRQGIGKKRTWCVWEHRQWRCVDVGAATIGYDRMYTIATYGRKMTIQRNKEKK